MTVETHFTSGGKLDRQGFEKLFRHYFPPLMAFAKKILADEDDSREVVQRVFINLWEKRDEIDATASLKSYLFTSVHNRSLNVIRDRKKFSAEEVPDVVGEVDVGAQIEAMELEEKIREAIEALPEKTRQVFELNRFGGLKYSEIADQLNISVKTVENQMSRALRMLREKLLKYLSLLLWLVLNALN
ncbi:MAG: RNA polymerase sigma-70 factor [Bacteroidales bacterium]